MTAILTEDWLDQNADRRYPLMDGASARAVDDWDLPNSILVDLQIYAPNALDPVGFYIGSIIGYGTGLVLTINHTSSALVVGTLTVPQIGQLQTISIVGANDSHVAGSAIINATELLGNHDFDVEATRVIPTVVRGDPLGVS